MGKYSKLREKILAGGADANIEFAELCKLLGRLGFEERVKGDHHIFTGDGVADYNPRAQRRSCIKSDRSGVFL